MAPVPPVEPERPHSEQVRRRLDGEKASLKKQVEEAQTRLKELEEYKGKYEETSTKYTELETVAQQREARIKEAEGWYRNEESALKINPMDMEPVREAAYATRRELDQFVPSDISGPGESPLPINTEEFIQTHRETLHTAIKDWQTIGEMANIPAQAKGKLQHLVISSVAKALGVPDESFEDEDIQGTSYKMIDPRHPVFQHLKSRMNPLVQATRQFQNLKENAEKAPLETARTVISKRQQEAVATVRKSGIGLTGEDLQTALKHNPDNQNLQIMAAMEAHPDILKELTTEIENEAMVTGHLRRQFDIPVTEPEARDKTGRMLQARFDERAISAPLIKPLKKLAVQQMTEIRELKEKLKEREQELEKLTSQGETGSSEGGDSMEKPKGLGDRWSDPAIAKVLARMGGGV